MNMETMRKTAIERDIEREEAENNIKGKNLHHIIMRSEKQKDLPFDEYIKEVTELSDCVDYNDPRYGIDAFIWMMDAVHCGYMDSLIESCAKLTEILKYSEFKPYQIEAYEELTEYMEMFKNLVEHESMLREAADEADPTVIDLRKVRGITC